MLKIVSEISLEDFRAWSGAVDTLDKLKEHNKCDIVENILEDEYPDGLTDTELNDILRFDSDTVFEWAGLDENGDEPEDEEEEED